MELQGYHKTYTVKDEHIDVQDIMDGLYYPFYMEDCRHAFIKDTLGFDLEEAQAQGLELVYASPVELQIDSIIVDMFRRIQQRGVRRLVIDALGDLASAATDPQRLHDYMYALVQHFAVSTITSVLNFETSGNAIAGDGMQNAMSYLSDNVLLLHPTGAAGGFVRSGTRKGTAELSGRELLIAVRDSGVGIPAKHVLVVSICFV